MIYKATLTSRLLSTTRDGQRDEFRHEAQAMVAVHDDGSWSLRYHDDENGGQTAISGNSGWTTIQREGHVRSRMRFVHKELLPALYITPMGEFDMSTMTHHCQFSIDANSGHLTLHYDLLLSGELAAQNQLEIKWIVKS